MYSGFPASSARLRAQGPDLALSPKTLNLNTLNPKP